MVTSWYPPESQWVHAWAQCHQKAKRPSLRFNDGLSGIRNMHVLVKPRVLCVCLQHIRDVIRSPFWVYCMHFHHNFFKKSNISLQNESRCVWTNNVLVQSSSQLTTAATQNSQTADVHIRHTPRYFVTYRILALAASSTLVILNTTVSFSCTVSGSGWPRVWNTSVLPYNQQDSGLQKVS